MRGLFKVILAAVTILFSALLIQRSCHEDPGKPDPYRPGGVAMVTQPPVLSGASNATPMAHITQNASSAASDAPTAIATAPTERPEAHGETVAAARRATPIRTQAKANDEMPGTARTTTARAARRTVARTKTVRRTEPERRAAAAKKSNSERVKPMND
jgi:hypothetical protein